jgi:cobalt-precorrin 5A hydrolase/precorrin-3B C17-methyltransferase
MTMAAQAALQAAGVVMGYQFYLDLIRPLLNPSQQQLPSPIGHELERARQAIELAEAGQRVALVSSGDIGVYGMASPLFEALQQRYGAAEPDIGLEVYPGVSAIQAAAARLGAPLGHDFCAISLSDLLTPWPVIERRLQAAAWGDFVIGFYNPRSQKRDWQLPAAFEILLAYRPQTTPVAIARNVSRPDEQITLTTLAEMEPAQVDMFTLVLVGNSQTYAMGERLVTPRGYGGVEEWRSGRVEEWEGGENAKPSHHPITPSPHYPGSDLYPITLINMARKQAVVIGGGPVGERKAAGLLQASASVRLISPEATPQLREWARAGQIEWRRQPYQPGDLAGADLVFAATNQRPVNAQVAAEAKSLGLLCNIADQPEAGNFHVPAVHRQDDLVVSVSTTQKNPKRARTIRDQIGAWLSKAADKSQ